MKKLIFLIVIGLTIGACTDIKESPEYQALKEKNDSLMTISNGQNVDIYNYLTEFNEIQENLNEIKRRENIIDVNRKGIKENNSENKITEDINSIYNLLKENKKKLAALNTKYKKSKSKNKHLDRLVKSLNDQIALKNEEIIELNKELEILNIEIQDVYFENDIQTEIINQQEDKLHTAYYVVGTTKELKEHKIINKTGGFLGIGRNSMLDQNFDKKYFTEINTVQFNKIGIYSKKVRVVTTHPKDSYKFEGENKKVDNLIIKDPEAFWSVSKYLVLEVTK